MNQQFEGLQRQMPSRPSMCPQPSLSLISILPASLKRKSSFVCSKRK